jgi:hypothetical protein
MKYFFQLFFVFSISIPSFAKTQTKEFRYQDFKIVVTEISPDNPSPTNQAISLKIETIRGNKVIDTVDFANVDPNEGEISKYSPGFLKEFFVLKKPAIYDDRLLLVTKVGQILNVAVGDIYRDPNNVYFLRVNRDGVSTVDKSKVSLKTFSQEPFDKDFPPNLKTAKAWDSQHQKWIPAEGYLIYDESLDKSIPAKEYLKLKPSK